MPSWPKRERKRERERERERERRTLDKTRRVGFERKKKERRNEEREEKKKKNLSSESFSSGRRSVKATIRFTGERNGDRGISRLQSDNWIFHFGCNARRVCL